MQGTGAQTDDRHQDNPRKPRNRGAVAHDCLAGEGGELRKGESGAMAPGCVGHIRVMTSAVERKGKLLRQKALTFPMGLESLVYLLLSFSLFHQTEQLVCIFPYQEIHRGSAIC